MCRYCTHNQPGADIASSGFIGICQHESKARAGHWLFSSRRGHQCWRQGILSQLSALGTRAAHPLIPLPSPRRTHNFSAARLQEGINLGPDLMPRMKNGARKPPGVPSCRQQWVTEALCHLVVTRLPVPCPPLPVPGRHCPPSPYFPSTSSCPLHTGHVRR